jgi:hypothetical protein
MYFVTTQVLIACHPGENRDPGEYLHWIPVSPAFAGVTAGMTNMRNIQGAE